MYCFWEFGFRPNPLCSSKMEGNNVLGSLLVLKGIPFGLRCLFFCDRSCCDPSSSFNRLHEYHIFAFLPVNTCRGLFGWKTRKMSPLVHLLHASSHHGLAQDPQSHRSGLVHWLRPPRPPGTQLVSSISNTAFVEQLFYDEHKIKQGSSMVFTHKSRWV